ncbi:hypothetical protein BST36_09880 [Mycolicibacterium moriokaense]|jgi:hypothetical protein|uniref:Uncharacterized protein n=1 Tax=Mycolicibacterium moriokaense TaxID=39691 RepID=A0AAD1HCK2_9MYCO|nr:hypothetical protein [Mycolicibacterium moriokaense]MCV7038466.1 hypothetical protein [Mycolicibacterium moriokaense]ORB24868.1 hypothetical protein BST36_09880 [Mycolicibacterium moriokaense]BBX02411.1 hypothetical protein MMOR_33470 [Mycolicibacterium moriokaense]
MGIARLSATGLAVAALVIGVAATGCSKNDKESSAEETTSATSSTTTSAEATTTEESATEETSAAEFTDYGSLLIPASDLGADTQTPGGVQLNPGGQPGAGQVYTDAEGKERIIDTILVLPNAESVAQSFDTSKGTLNTVTTGQPESADVGDQGVVAVGTSPDGSKSVTSVLFSQGLALVSIDFEGTLEHPMDRDGAIGFAQKQAERIAELLPEE